MTQGSYEIPEAVRKMAEDGVRMTQDAYTQLAQLLQQAQTLTAGSAVLAGEQVKQVHHLSLRFADENAKAGFNFAAALANAKTAADWAELHRDFVARQALVYASQSRELASAMSRLMQR